MVCDYEQLAALASYRAGRTPPPVRENAGQHLLDAKPGTDESSTRQARHTNGGTPLMQIITDSEDG